VEGFPGSPFITTPFNPVAVIAFPIKEPYLAITFEFFEPLPGSLFCNSLAATLVGGIAGIPLLPEIEGTLIVPETVQVNVVAEKFIVFAKFPILIKCISVDFVCPWVFL
jgi:hypothetical protein